MKLSERLPDHIEVHGRKIRCDFDFRNVLRFMDILGRDDLIQNAKEWLALKCLMKRPPKDTKAALDAVRVVLFPERKRRGDNKITDFVQDADYIRAAFLQTYGINLWRDKLHWVEFSGLLAGLPEGTRYAEILSIRTRPMPEPTKYNAKERQWLAKAKAEYAVQMSDKEQERLYEQSVKNITAGLLAFAERGGAKVG